MTLGIHALNVRVVVAVLHPVTARPVGVGTSRAAQEQAAPGADRSPCAGVAGSGPQQRASHRTNGSADCCAIHAALARRLLR